jgi:hypothetical protein
MCNQDNLKRVGIRSLRVRPLIPTHCRNGFSDKSDHQKITLHNATEMHHISLATRWEAFSGKDQKDRQKMMVQNATELLHISRAARTPGELSATAPPSADSGYVPRTQAGRFSSQCPLRHPHSSQLQLTYQS